MLVGLGGVALLVGPSGGGERIDVVGALVLTLSALAWAIGSLFSRNAPMPRPTLLGAAVQMLAGGTAQFAAGIATGQLAAFAPGDVSTQSLVAFAYLVVGGALVGYTAYIWLVEHVPPVQATTYAYVNPIVAVLLGWAVAGEQLGGRVLVAMAVIVGAVALVTVGQHGNDPSS